jgi:hypothetical protein
MSDARKTRSGGARGSSLLAAGGLQVLLCLAPLACSGPKPEGQPGSGEASPVGIIPSPGAVPSPDLAAPTPDPEVQKTWEGLRVGRPSPEVHPPAPPVDPRLPPDVARALPRTPDGRPIIAQGGGVALVYDETLDDPIARWGQCLGRVTACFKTNRQLGGCVDLIEVCPTNRGGRNCCPRACLDQYNGLRAGGMAEREAMAASFVKGDCVEGLKEQREAAQTRH